jgi:isoquinoline 1-oxidoreductase beta subunit
MSSALDAPINPSRRAFLIRSSVVGGALMLSFVVPMHSADASAARNFEPNAFLRIDPDGSIIMTIPQVEMGQGIYTALAMIIAEELDADFDRVSVAHAPPDEKLYANPAFGMQATGGSTSVRAFWLPMRTAGATARAMLVRAAAARWRVDPSTCRTEKSTVFDDARGRKATYGELVTDAAHQRIDKTPSLKSPANFRLIGRPLKRLDAPSKVNGSAVYGIDARPPGLRVATFATSPMLGGKVKHVDERHARQVPGVTDIVVLDDVVAVVGKHMWAAKQGLAALQISWEEGAHGRLSTAQILNQAREASEKVGAVGRTTGDVGSAIGEKVDAIYHVPFLAHATMEPMNCTAHVRPDGCEVWVGNQVLSRAQAIAAQVTGLSLDKVVVHNHLIGGGFGRRLEVDGVERAVRIAQKVNAPVKVIWSREEDISKPPYRPLYLDRLSARVTGGKITSWYHKIVGSSVMARWAPPAFVNGLDPDAVDGAIDYPYDTANVRVEYVRDEPPAVETCFWRSVGAGHNIFVVESFVDELAHRVKADPVAFRRAQLRKNPRLQACLDLAAQRADWGAPLPPRSGRGVAVQTVFGSYVAAVADVNVDAHGEIVVNRIVCAVDCGVVVNPDTVVAQIEGGLIFGLTAALHGEITIVDGRVQQTNFHNYRMMRIDEAPAIEVHLIRSAEAPGGIGEPGTSIAAPALANALFAATGVRFRQLPIERKALAAGASA